MHEVHISGWKLVFKSTLVLFQRKSTCYKCPWFIDEIKNQKQVLRRHVKIWHKYLQYHQWVAYNAEKWKYSYFQDSKRSVIIERVLDCNRVAKQLYSLASNLTSSTKENPLPDCKSDEELAESFSKFFMNNIKKIIDSLESFPKYQPMHRNMMMLSRFTPYLEEEITKIIKNMTSKHCELDPVLTWFLNEILSFVISPITSIITVSLEHGIFASQ